MMLDVINIFSFLVNNPAETMNSLLTCNSRAILNLMLAACLYEPCSHNSLLQQCPYNILGVHTLLTLISLLSCCVLLVVTEFLVSAQVLKKKQDILNKSNIMVS